MTQVKSTSRRTFLLTASAAATISLGHTQFLFASSVPSVTMGTATPGGGFQLFGATFAKAANEAHAPIEIVTVDTKGSGDNLKRLAAGKIDFGQVEGNAAHRAFQQQKDSPDKLLIAAAMYPGPGMFVVRRDSPIRSIDDLKGKRVALGTRSSGLTILAKSILTGLGIDPEKDIHPVYLEKSGHGVKKLLEKEIDAWWGGGFGWPGFVKVSNSASGARFIVPDPAGLQRIMEHAPHLKPMTVPSGSYPGIENDLQTVGMWSFILTRPSLPDESAAKMAEAAHMAGPIMAKQIPQARYTTPGNTAANAPDGLIHPGAAAYLKQIGALR